MGTSILTPPTTCMHAFRPNGRCRQHIPFIPNLDSFPNCRSNQLWRLWGAGNPSKPFDHGACVTMFFCLLVNALYNPPRPPGNPRRSHVNLDVGGTRRWVRNGSSLRRFYFLANVLRSPKDSTPIKISALTGMALIGRPRLKYIRFII